MNTELSKRGHLGREIRTWYAMQCVLRGLTQPKDLRGAALRKWRRDNRLPPHESEAAELPVELSPELRSQLIEHFSKENASAVTFVRRYGVSEHQLQQLLTSLTGIADPFSYLPLIQKALVAFQRAEASTNKSPSMLPEAAPTVFATASDGTLVETN